MSFSSSPRELLLLENQYSGTLKRVIILLSQLEIFPFFPLFYLPFTKSRYSVVKLENFRIILFPLFLFIARVYYATKMVEIQSEYLKERQSSKYHE